MIEVYLQEPKPVIWDDMATLFTKDNYRKEVGRLYPDLLRKRRELYRTYAKKIVPFHEHKTTKWSATSLL
jgi:hypothetical protein